MWLAVCPHVRRVHAFSVRLLEETLHWEKRRRGGEGWGARGGFLVGGILVLLVYPFLTNELGLRRCAWRAGHALWAEVGASISFPTFKEIIGFLKNGLAKRTC